MDHFLFWPNDIFFSFLHSIWLISTWNDKIFDFGSKKKVCSALPWIWWLNKCKWAPNIYFWKFHENWTLCFLKNWLFGSKLSARAIFKIFRNFLFPRYFQVKSCKGNPKLDLLKKKKKWALSSVVCLQRSLKYSFGCHHWIVQRKSSLTQCIWIETFKSVLWTNYSWQNAKISCVGTIAIIFTAVNLKKKKSEWNQICDKS